METFAGKIVLDLDYKLEMDDPESAAVMEAYLKERSSTEGLTLAEIVNHDIRWFTALATHRELCSLGIETKFPTLPDRECSTCGKTHIVDCRMAECHRHDLSVDLSVAVRKVDDVTRELLDRLFKGAEEEANKTEGGKENTV